jgi:hypothetical protein
MKQKQNLLDLLDKKIRDNHTKRLMSCKEDDFATLEKIEKDFQEDMSAFGINQEESKKLFNRLKNTHL